MRLFVSAVNYYRDRGSWVSAAANTTVLFFKDGSAFSELDSNGALPDNRSGQLTGLQVRFRTITSSTLTDVAAKAHIHDANLVRDLRASIILNNVEVFGGPVYCYPHSPLAISGQLTVTSAGAVNLVYAQNAGYQYMTVSHPITRQQSVQGRLFGIGAVGTTVPIEFCLQVSDRKEVRA